MKTAIGLAALVMGSLLLGAVGGFFALAVLIQRRLSA